MFMGEAYLCCAVLCCTVLRTCGICGIGVGVLQVWAVIAITASVRVDPKVYVLSAVCQDPRDAVLRAVPSSWVLRVPYSVFL